MTPFRLISEGRDDFPYFLFELDEMDSTSLEAKRRIQEMTGSGVWIIEAKRQTQGYGRKGNPWISDHEGNYYGTFCVNQKMTLPPGMWSLWVAHQICEALKSRLRDMRHANAGSEGLFVKWPNDLCLFRDQTVSKVGGILTEVLKGRTLCGVGLNLSQAPSMEANAHTGVLRAGKLGLSGQRVVSELRSCFYELALDLMTDHRLEERIKRALSQMFHRMREVPLHWYWLAKAGELQSVELLGICEKTAALKVRFGNGSIQDLIHGSLYVEAAS